MSGRQFKDDRSHLSSGHVRRIRRRWLGDLDDESEVDPSYYS